MNAEYNGAFEVIALMYTRTGSSSVVYHSGPSTLPHPNSSAMDFLNGPSFKLSLIPSFPVPLPLSFHELKYLKGNTDKTHFQTGAGEDEEGKWGRCLSLIG